MVVLNWVLWDNNRLPSNAPLSPGDAEVLAFVVGKSHGNKNPSAEIVRNDEFLARSSANATIQLQTNPVRVILIRIKNSINYPRPPRNAGDAVSITFHGF